MRSYLHKQAHDELIRQVVPRRRKKPRRVSFAKGERDCEFQRARDNGLTPVSGARRRLCRDRRRRRTYLFHLKSILRIFPPLLKHIVRFSPAGRGLFLLRARDQLLMTRDAHAAVYDHTLAHFAMAKLVLAASHQHSTTFFLEALFYCGFSQTPF